MAKVRSVKTSDKPIEYFSKDSTITMPSTAKTFFSRLAFPLLCLMSREQSLKFGLTPIDDERVIIALKSARGRTLDIGCGANNFIRSYGDGLGVDVFGWDGCDMVIDDAAKLPFSKEEFNTVSYLACLNHIPNREESVKDAYRVTKKGGRIIVTMITPRLGAFIHWLRFSNDPDHKARCIDHSHELMGMSAAQIEKILRDAGFTDIKRTRFVFGLNNLYIGKKSA